MRTRRSAARAIASVAALVAVTAGVARGAPAAGPAAPAAAAAAASAVDEAAQRTQGRALFTAGAVPACALCHTLKAAGAHGAVGPVLDELQPDADRVLRALRNGIGAMPSFRDKLSDEQMAALAAYVAWASRQP